MHSFLAHLHKEHPKAKPKSFGSILIEAPKEPQILIFGNALSNVGADEQYGYNPVRHVNLAILGLSCLLLTVVPESAINYKLCFKC